MDHAAARGANRNHRPFQERKHPPRRRQGDLTNLAEDRDLGGVGPHRVEQFDGLVLGSVGHRAGRSRKGEGCRRSKQRSQVERERDRHRRLNSEARRWSHGVDQSEPVGGLEHQALALNPAAMSAR